MSKEVPEKAAHTFVNVTIRDRAILGTRFLWIHRLPAYMAAPPSLCDLCTSTVTAYCLFCACVHPAMYRI